MKKSEKLIRHLEIARRQMNAAENKFYCHELEKVGLKYSDDQRKAMQDAQRLFHDAKTKLSATFSGIIGDQIMREIGL